MRRRVDLESSMGSVGVDWSEGFVIFRYAVFHRRRLQGEIPFSVARPFVVGVVSVFEKATGVEARAIDVCTERALGGGAQLLFTSNRGLILREPGGGALRAMLVFSLQLHVEDTTVPITAVLMPAAEAEAVPEPVVVSLRAFHRQARDAVE